MGSANQLGGSALRSTVNDLLKFVSANLGLTPNSLTPLMEKTHIVQLDQTLGMDLGLAWIITSGPQGTKIVWHAGGAPGYISFAGFDKNRHRGVVVLSSSWDLDVLTIGMLLLESEWLRDSHPTKISSQNVDSCVGQYELSPDFALGMFILRVLLLNTTLAVIYIPASLYLVLLVILFWRVKSRRKKHIIFGGAFLVNSLLAVLIVLVSSRVACALTHPVMGIRRDGDRIFVQYDFRLSPLTANFLPPAAAEALPCITEELLPESETQFFGRMTGMPVNFSRDDQDKGNRVTAQFFGTTFSHEKTSDQPPRAWKASTPRVAIKLDTKLLDACVGQYTFAPDTAFPTGIKTTIRREGDQLLWQARGKNAFPGDFNIYPESETNFFFKMSGAQLTFVKNDHGEVTAVSVHDGTWLPLPDGQGKKLKSE